MGKTVLPSKFQEWIGLDRIALAVHQMKCVYREITKDDYGIDGEIEIVIAKPSGEGYEASGGIIKFQAKSGKSYVVEDSKTSFSTPVQKSDLEYWHKSNFPILLIVYHPADDKLYYKEVKEYLRVTPNIFQAPHKVRFDKTEDEFHANDTAYERLFALAQASPARVSRDQRERLYSNLLLVKKLPKLITCASTRYTSRDSIIDKVKGSSRLSGGRLAPFFVKEKKLYTLDDLRDPKCSLRGFCNTRNINDDSAELWSKDACKRNDLVFLLNQLLGSHLWRCGLAYSRDYKRSYFRRLDDVHTVFRKPWYNVRTGANVVPRITVQYYEYGLDKFWRHTAANINFKPIGDSWFLQIVPRYFFTEDGEIPCHGDMVGPYTTKLKAREWNPQVLNHVLFWSDVISQGQPEIQIKLHQYTLVRIERLPHSGIAPFAIPGDPAIYYEEETTQLDIPGLLGAPIVQTPQNLYEDERFQEGVGEGDEY